MTQCKKSNKKRTKNIKYHKVAFYKTIETKLINPFFFVETSNILLILKVWLVLQ